MASCVFDLTKPCVLQFSFVLPCDKSIGLESSFHLHVFVYDLHTWCKGPSRQILCAEV